MLELELEDRKMSLSLRIVKIFTIFSRAQSDIAIDCLGWAEQTSKSGSKAKVALAFLTSKSKSIIIVFFRELLNDYTSAFILLGRAVCIYEAIKGKNDPRFYKVFPFLASFFSLVLSICFRSQRARIFNQCWATQWASWKVLLLHFHRKNVQILHHQRKPLLIAITIGKQTLTKVGIWKNWRVLFLISIFSSKKSHICQNLNSFISFTRSASAACRSAIA